jgi:hypothetical protein
MPLTADQRCARARLAAHRRHHPNDPPPDPATAELEQRANQAVIETLLARAPRLTAAQCAEVARLFPVRQPIGVEEAT